MSAARDEILARVRTAIGGAEPPEPVSRTYRRAAALDRSARIALLTERLVDYRARVVHTTEQRVQADVDAAVGGGRIGVPPGLSEAWRPRGAVVDGGFSTDELDALDAVLTGCTVAIAETGTLVLSGGASEGRRALTLVPDLHVCIVRADQIVETVPEAFDALRGLEQRPLTFVSGPSATSDIELKRVEGVHGPRTLVVLIVEEED